MLNQHIYKKSVVHRVHTAMILVRTEKLKFVIFLRISHTDLNTQQLFVN